MGGDTTPLAVAVCPYRHCDFFGCRADAGLEYVLPNDEVRSLPRRLPLVYLPTEIAD